MSKFKDEKGDTWKLRITMGSIKKVHDDTGMNLSQMLDDNMSLAKEIMSDGLKAVAVLFSLLEEQLDKAKVSEQEFAERMYGDTFDKAKVALWEAFQDFCPSQQRDLLKRLEARTEKIQEEARNALEKELRSISLEQHVKMREYAG